MQLLCMKRAPAASRSTPLSKVLDNRARFSYTDREHVNSAHTELCSE